MARHADDLKFLTDEFESMAFRRRGYERDALLQAVIDRSGFKDLVESEEAERGQEQPLATLPEEQRSLLSAGIDDKTVDAMRMVVEFVLGMGGEPVEGDQTVTMQRRALEQLCVWQLVVGYRLREAEAKGDARQRLGN